MKLLITGSDGFIGRNLRLHLAERTGLEVVCFTREQKLWQLPDLLDGVEFIFHLAGVNRPQDPAEFAVSNTDLTVKLSAAVARVASATGRKIPVVFSSSSQAILDNPYGASKRAAEDTLFAIGRAHV